MVLAAIRGWLKEQVRSTEDSEQEQALIRAEQRLSVLDRRLAIEELRRDQRRHDQEPHAE
jgi:hypothetical protein